MAICSVRDHGRSRASRTAVLGATPGWLAGTSTKTTAIRPGRAVISSRLPRHCSGSDSTTTLCATRDPRVAQRSHHLADPRGSADDGDARIADSTRSPSTHRHVRSRGVPRLRAYPAVSPPADAPWRTSCEQPPLQMLSICRRRPGERKRLECRRQAGSLARSVAAHRSVSPSTLFGRRPDEEHLPRHFGGG
jgi:hypothetical protein